MLTDKSTKNRIAFQNTRVQIRDNNERVVRSMRLRRHDMGGGV